MGFGTSMTQAIFFIASAVIALAIVSVATVSISSLANSFGQKSAELSSQIKSGITITGDLCYLSGSTYVYVKNTGKSFLNANASDVYLDGATEGISAIYLFRGNVWVEYSTMNTWAPGELARFTLSSSLPAGYHRLMFVTENGVFDKIEYSDC
ncbi:MAG: hypothetical protein V1909_04030 [Candidatus Micrarchaeota archaeon]